MAFFAQKVRPRSARKSKPSRRKENHISPADLSAKNPSEINQLFHIRLGPNISHAEGVFHKLRVSQFISHLKSMQSLFKYFTVFASF